MRADEFARLVLASHLHSISAHSPRLETQPDRLVEIRICAVVGLLVRVCDAAPIEGGRMALGIEFDRRFVICNRALGGACEGCRLNGKVR